MDNDDVQRFDNYWRTITRNEEFIQQWGHNLRTDWRDRWHQDLEDAYLIVRPLLVPVTRSRMFHHLPGGINPFEAENYHHALMLLLNPPERWFENALKREAENEELLATGTGLAAPAMVTSPGLFDGVNDTAWDILQAMDRIEPRRWKEIGRLAGYSEDKVRQYSTELQEKQFIKKTPRGFVRLVTLPDECESQ